MSNVTIVVDGIGDIAGSVVFAETNFESQMGAVPGTAQVTVKDPSQTLDFITGKQLVLTIDGTPMWGGYIMQVQRGFFFPVDNTSVPSAVKTRKWTLQCTDFNILFDKRVIRNTSGYLAALPSFSTSRKMGELLRNELFAKYLDLPADLDCTTYVDDFICRSWNSFGAETCTDKLVAWVQQGSYWRAQMDDFAQWGAIYYISPDKAVHFHGYESIVMPWGFSDRPNRLALPSSEVLATYGMREFSETDDGTALANDAFVWGGSEWAGNGTTVFDRKTNSTSVADHNLWQFPDVDFANIKIQSEATATANKLVFGSTDAGIGPQSGYGLGNIQKIVSCVWFDKDVPKLAGVPQHVRPGYIMPMRIFTYGDGVNPLELNLPLRSVAITFPTLNPDGNPYIRFDGQFGLQTTDPHWLWVYLLRLKTAPAAPPAPAVATNSSTSSMYGAPGSFEFTPTAGQTLFTLPFAYIPGTTQFFLNGLLQRLGIDYSETDPEAGTVTFSEGLTTADKVVVECRTA